VIVIGLKFGTVVGEAASELNRAHQAVSTS
jgi:hypothetical protein